MGRLSLRCIYKQANISAKRPDSIAAAWKSTQTAIIAMKTGLYPPCGMQSVMRDGSRDVTLQPGHNVSQLLAATATQKSAALLYGGSFRSVATEQ